MIFNLEETKELTIFAPCESNPFCFLQLRKGWYIQRKAVLLTAFHFFKLFNHAVEVVTEPSIVGGSCFF